MAELRDLVGHRQHLLDRVDRQVLVAGVGGEPHRRDVEIVAPAMRDIDLHPGQLAEDAVVEAVPAEQVDAAGLVAHVVAHRREGDLARERGARVEDGLDRADLAAQPGLHVHHPVAEHPAVLDGAVERVAGPAFADRLGVEMAGEQEMRAGPAAVDLPQRVRAPVEHLLAPHPADADLRMRSSSSAARVASLPQVLSVRTRPLGDVDRERVLQALPVTRSSTSVRISHPPLSPPDYAQPRTPLHPHIGRSFDTPPSGAARDEGKGSTSSRVAAKPRIEGRAEPGRRARRRSAPGRFPCQPHPASPRPPFVISTGAKRSGEILFPWGERFLRCAALRAAPVEMTRGERVRA